MRGIGMQEGGGQLINESGAEILNEKGKKTGTQGAPECGQEVQPQPIFASSHKRGDHERIERNNEDEVV